MGWVDYAVGVVCVAVVLASAAFVAVRLRARLLPGMRGGVARLAEVVLGTSTLLVLSEAVGLADGFRRPVLVAAALVAALAVAVLVRPGDPGAARTTVQPGSRTTVAAATVGVSLVGLQWLAAVRAAARTGVLAVDSLDYHLPFAAWFVQTHSTRRLDYVSAGDPSPYYPQNHELLHGLAMALTGRDTVVLLLGLAGLVVTYLAVWAIGARFGAGPLAVCAVSIPLSLLGPSYAASAGNDWTAAWALLAAVAVFLHGRRGAFGTFVVGGLAAGIAAGTRFNYAVPVAALVLGAAFLAERGTRLRRFVVGALAAALAGGFWYVRNVVAVGTPTPGVSLRLGPLSLPGPPMPHLGPVDHTVADYLTNTHVVRTAFVPGLHWFFGPMWAVILLLIALGLVGGVLLPARRGVRPLALLGLLCLGVYLVTPLTAGGPLGHPVLFRFNIRFGLAAYVLGLVVMPLVRPLQRWAGALAGGLTLVLLVGMLRKAAWSPGVPVSMAVAAALLLAAAAVPTFVGRTGWAWRPQVLAVTAAGAAVVLAVVGYPFQTHYLQDRYRGTATPRERLFAAMQGVHDARIAVVGFPAKYPFLGARLDNRVDYLAQHGRDDAFEDYATCTSWLRAVHDGRYDYVVAEPYAGQPAPRAARWTAGVAHVVTADTAGWVFRIDRPLLDQRLGSGRACSA